jgi:hypothetical protein
MRPFYFTLPALLALAGPTASPTPAATPEAPPFTFAAIGCMPYQRLPGANESFARVIAEIDRQQPAFTVHLGDIIGGEDRCTDELLRRRRDDFNSFAGPLVYTPGDNEWTDVHAERAGRLDPLERLAKVRELFFASERSLGRQPLPLVTQRRDAAFARYVENARWSLGGVVFATVHVVGSQNNHAPDRPGALEEFRARDLANEAWVQATFAEATRTSARGIALFFQANPIGETLRPGFERFLKTVEAGARAFGRPVLLVHADEHRYRFEPAIRFHAAGERIPNVTRLETFGAANFHGVLVTVDPGSTDVFLPGPLLVPGNPRPLLPRPKAAK